MKQLSKVFISMMIAVMIFTQVASAKSVDVTAEYQVQINEILGHFDQYFGFSCGKNKGFKFNDYTRTGMIMYSDLFQYTDNIKAGRRQIKPALKKFFNSRTIKIHKFKKDMYWPNGSWLWVIDNGKLRYTGGNWGEDMPDGRVLSVIKKGKKKLIATYQIRWYDTYNKIHGDEMGIFTVTFKKKSGTYFISNIRRTRTNNCLGIA